MKRLSKKQKRLLAKKRKKVFVQAFLLICLIVLLGAYIVFSLFKNFAKPAALPPAEPPVLADIQYQATTTLDVIRHGDVSKKNIIFTFDGGGDNVGSGDKILQVLAKHHIKGTFFLTGKVIEFHSDWVKRVIAAGHEIFNHTYDHPDLTLLSDIQITEELTRMDSILRNLGGHSTKPYFRAPYGSYDRHVLAVAAKQGYRSVFWTTDAMDWKADQGETAGQVKERILANVAPGIIYLMHVGDSITGEILDDVFNTIESKGYRIVSLTQGL